MTEPDGGAERAARFFRERGLDRVLDAARAAYWRNGRPAGTIVLADATIEEHGGIAALNGRPIRHGPLRIELVDLDAWLACSGFGCTLVDALTAYDGRSPLSRAEERARASQVAAERREELRGLIAEVVDELPAESLGQHWLLNGAHGLEWLVQRYEKSPPRELPTKPALLRTVLRALSALPLAEPKRLATFANEVAGDPHAFDDDHEAGRLLAQALLDLVGTELGLAPVGGDRLTADDRRALFAHVGLLRETISSTVAVYGLRSVGRRDDTIDVSAPAIAPLQLLSLRQLLNWHDARPVSPDVFVVENPVVFEDLLDGIASDSVGPCLICTAGWFNLATWRLLALLIESGEVRSICYSGDFDLNGLRIAGSLLRRYPTQVRPWRFAASDYHLACRPPGLPVAADDLGKLATLPPEFADLARAIQETGRWAYQEAIAPLLLADVLAARLGATSEETR